MRVDEALAEFEQDKARKDRLNAKARRMARSLDMTQKARLDAMARLLKLSTAVELAALHAGATSEEAQACGAAIYQVAAA